MFVRSGDGDFNVLNSLATFVEIVFIKLLSCCTGLLASRLLKLLITLEIVEIVISLFIYCEGFSSEFSFPCTSMIASSSVYTTASDLCTLLC
jgi:multisubunit Na+/H+ antiporter MnhC subunit